MVELERIPLWVKLSRERPGFIKLEGEWYVWGEVADLPIGQNCLVFRRANGDEVEVLVVEHIMSRRVKHRGDTELTEYVIARFE